MPNANGAGPQTRLGKIQNGRPDPVSVGRLTQAAITARVLHEFTIPRLNVHAIMTLCPHSRKQQIEADVYSKMSAHKLPYERATESLYEAERATRTLAEVVLDPESVKRGNPQPFGTLEEWDALDEQVIEDCWRVYLDVRAANDPISVPLTREEYEFIELMIQKKNDQGLRYFGARRLSAYLLTMAVQPASSPKPTSTPTDGSSDSSMLSTPDQDPPLDSPTTPT